MSFCNLIVFQPAANSDDDGDSVIEILDSSDDEDYDDADTDTDASVEKPTNKPEPVSEVQSKVQIKPCSVRLKRLDDGEVANATKVDARNDATKVDDDVDQLLKTEFRWIGDPVAKIRNQIFYEKVSSVGVIAVGDFVRTDAGDVCRVVQLFEREFEFFAHLQEFWNSDQTILGQTSDLSEIFEVNRDCLPHAVGDKIAK